MDARVDIRKALDAWIRDGQELKDAFKQRPEIHTREEAGMVVKALLHFREIEASFETPYKKYMGQFLWGDLVGLFNRVKTREAVEVLREHGLPILRDVVRNNIESNAKQVGIGGDSLSILAILLLYRDPADFDYVVSTIHSGYESDGFLWGTVFRNASQSTNFSEFIDRLRKPLPFGYVGILYLDQMNKLAFDGKLTEHPFSTDEGVARLIGYLSSANQKEYSYAISAVAAIPFVQHTAKAQLLTLARAHADPNVRLEAEWAAARSGDETGFTRLAANCLDPALSTRAVTYLKELKAEDFIPPDCMTPDFKALAGMIEWLSHPNERERPPAQIDLLDSRELTWPPTGTRLRLWLFKFAYPEEGNGYKWEVAMSGSVTFALGLEVKDVKPEEYYVAHCAWELEMQEKAAGKIESKQVKKLLAKLNPHYRW